MMEWTTSRAVLGGALLLLSGCLSGPSAPRGPGAQASDEAIPVDDITDDTCGLEGFVVDDALEGIANVLVKLDETPFSTLTGAEGQFAFAALFPKTYRISAHPRGFEKFSRSVECPPGDIVDDLVLRLQGIPDFGRQFYHSFYLRGKYGCGLGISSFQQDDNCKERQVTGGTYTPDIIPEANNSLYLRPHRQANTTGALYELKWTKTSSLGSDYLSFGLWPPNTDAKFTPCPGTEVPYSTIAWGRSRACVRMDPGPKTGSVYSPAEWTNDWKLLVRPSGNITLTPTIQDHSSKLVVDQSFEFVATLFYNGLRVPEGWSYFA